MKKKIFERNKRHEKKENRAWELKKKYFFDFISNSRA